jgi:hypothetical protein
VELEVEGWSDLKRTYLVYCYLNVNK